MADAAAAAFAAVGVVRRGYAGAKRCWDTMMMTEGVIHAVLSGSLARRVYLKAKRGFAPRFLTVKERASMILVDVGAFDQRDAEAFMDGKTYVPMDAREKVIQQITAGCEGGRKMTFLSDEDVDALHLIGTRLGSANARFGAHEIVKGGQLYHAPMALIMPLLDVNSRLIPCGDSGLKLALGSGVPRLRYDEMLAAATESTLCDCQLIRYAAESSNFPQILQTVLRYAFDDGTGVPLPDAPITFATAAMAGAAQHANDAIHQRALAQERYRRDIWPLLTGLMGLGRGHAQLVLLVLTYVMGDRATTCKR